MKLPHITYELQAVRSLVKTIISIIGKTEDHQERKLTDPQRAIVQWTKFQLVEQLREKIRLTFELVGLAEIPLELLIQNYEYGGPECWKGTFAGLIESSRNALKAFQDENRAIREFDAAVQERRDAIADYQRLQSELDELEREAEAEEGEEWKEGHHEEEE